MGKSTFRRTRIVLGKDGAGQDFKAYGDTPGAYIRWDHANNKLVFAGGADMDFGSFGTPLTINQANNYPLGIFGHVSVANAEGTNVERGLWVRTKVSANQTGAFSIYGGQLQFRWADGAALLGSGVENAQYGGAWIYLEQDTTGQALADYAHASGLNVQVETFGNLTIPTNAHLSGVKVESRLGAANGAALTNVNGTIAGVFITKSPAASGVTAQNWPFGIVLENCDKGIDTSGMVLVPDSGRTKFAFAIGNRDQELTINLGNAASQNVEPFQMNVNLTASAGAPTSSSTVRLLRIRSTHDTAAMANLRIMNINTYMDVQQDMEAAYGQMNGVDFTTNAVALTTEAAVAAFNMECTSAVTGAVRGIIVNLHGATLPSTSIGVEVRSDGGAATLGEGIRVWSVGSCAITKGIDLRGNIKTLIEGVSTLTEADTAVHYTVSDTSTFSGGGAKGIQVQMTKTSGVISGSGEFIAIAGEIQVKANTSHAWAFSAYTGIANTPTIGDMAAFRCYCDNLGATAGNVGVYNCVTLGIDSTNEASNGNYFISMYSHGAAPTAAFYFPSSVGIDALIYFEQDVAPLSAGSGHTENDVGRIAINVGSTERFLHFYSD